ncbi:MAG TPA: darcynin family protein [Herpetosiphonaceae bacterium]|nr:darcynin family protein [Herpetosiphonaceae bacterium]
MDRTLTFFMLLKSTPAWLGMTRAERTAFIEERIQPIFARYSAVTLRFYDTEALSGRCTDVAVWETSDLRQYTFLIDALRDTPFFARPYFEVIEIIPGIEDSYRDYDQAMLAQAAS